MRTSLEILALWLLVFLLPASEGVRRQAARLVPEAPSRVASHSWSESVSMAPGMDGAMHSFTRELETSRMGEGPDARVSTIVRECRDGRCQEEEFVGGAEADPRLMGHDWVSDFFNDESSHAAVVPPRVRFSLDDLEEVDVFAGLTSWFDGEPFVPDAEASRKTESVTRTVQITEENGERRKKEVVTRCQNGKCLTEVVSDEVTPIQAALHHQEHKEEKKTKHKRGPDPSLKRDPSHHNAVAAFGVDKVAARAAEHEQKLRPEMQAANPMMDTPPSPAGAKARGGPDAGAMRAAKPCMDVAASPPAAGLGNPEPVVATKPATDKGAPTWSVRHMDPPSADSAVMSDKRHWARENFNGQWERDVKAADADAGRPQTVRAKVAEPPSKDKAPHAAAWQEEAPQAEAPEAHPWDGHFELWKHKAMPWRYDKDWWKKPSPAAQAARASAKTAPAKTAPASTEAQAAPAASATAPSSKGAFQRFKELAAQAAPASAPAAPLESDFGRYKQRASQGAKVAQAAAAAPSAWDFWRYKQNKKQARQNQQKAITSDWERDVKATAAAARGTPKAEAATATRPRRTMRIKDVQPVAKAKAGGKQAEKGESDYEAFKRQYAGVDWPQVWKKEATSSELASRAEADEPVVTKRTMIVQEVDGRRGQLEVIERCEGTHCTVEERRVSPDGEVTSSVRELDFADPMT